MELLLSNINVKNIRICGIDGKERQNLKELVNIPFEDENLTNYEVACTLSHVKAISIIEYLEGDYFMICEDDISIENLHYFDINLFDIIKNAPYFEILMVYHLV